MGPIHKKTYKGIATAPKIVSAKAMFITSKWLFLRSVFFDVKTTNVSKFPTEIKTASRRKTLHSTIPSTREWYDEDMLFELVAADTFFIFGRGCKCQEIGFLKWLEYSRSQSVWKVTGCFRET